MRNDFNPKYLDIDEAISNVTFKCYRYSFDSGYGFKFGITEDNHIYVLEEFKVDDCVLSRFLEDYVLEVNDA